MNREELRTKHQYVKVRVRNQDGTYLGDRTCEFEHAQAGQEP